MLLAVKTVNVIGKRKRDWSAQVVETSVNVTSNSPSQDYTHPDDHNLPNYVTITLVDQTYRSQE